MELSTIKNDEELDVEIAGHHLQDDDQLEDSKMLKRMRDD